MQEIMKAGKVPAGYRHATDAESLKMNRAFFDIERAKLKLDAAVAKKMALDEALKNAEREIEDCKLAFAGAVEGRKKVDREIGLDPNDKDAVLDDGYRGFLIREKKKEAAKPETREDRTKTLRAKLDDIQRQEAEIGSKLLDDPAYDPGDALLTGLLTMKQSAAAELASMTEPVGFAAPPPPGVAAPGVEFEVTHK